MSTLPIVVPPPSKTGWYIGGGVVALLLLVGLFFVLRKSNTTSKKTSSPASSSKTSASSPSSNPACLPNPTCPPERSAHTTRTLDNTVGDSANKVSTTISDAQLLDPSKKYFMYGPAIGANARMVPVSNAALLPDGTVVYYAYDDVYTKMVTHAGEARFYSGPTTKFDVNKWSDYTVAGSGSYKLRICPATCTNACNAAGACT